MIKLLKNAAIATMNRDFPRAEAAVIEGGYFAFVGTERAAEGWLEERGHTGFEIIDCGGRFVMPAFNDAHMHYLHYVKAKLSVDLFGTTSLAELLERMKASLQNHSPESGLWLMGEGWNQDFFTDEKRFPTAADLDRVSTEHPILIMRACFHVGVLNSKAMEMLGLDSAKAKEHGLFAETRPDGTPNGVVKEHVFDAIKSALPFPSMDTLVDMMVDSQKDLLSHGVVSVQSDDYKYCPQGGALEMMGKLRRAAEQGRFKLRIAEQILLDDPQRMADFFACGMDAQYGNRHFKIAVIKLLADGSLGARTALMRRPYADDPTTSGLAIFTRDELDALVLEAHRHNMGAIIHAIGDGAVDMCLDAIEKARTLMPHLHPRHGIVHCQITDKSQIMRFRELDIVAYTQPIFLDYDMHIVRSRVGDALAETSYAWKDYLRLGVHQAFGTDCPVESFKPLPGIYCAVTRKDLKGRGPYLPEQAVSMEEALYAYTAAGAYCSGEEDVKGQIRPGHLADFIIVDRNLLEIAPEDILSAQVLETWVDGARVYRA